MTVGMIDEMVAENVTIAMTAGQRMTTGRIGIIEIVMTAALIIGLDVDRNAVQNTRKRRRL